VQGSILPGYHADIVVWKPEAQFHLDDTHAVYHKHRVRFPTPQKTMNLYTAPIVLQFEPKSYSFCILFAEHLGVPWEGAIGQGPVDVREGEPGVRRREACRGRLRRHHPRQVKL
jgi:hypothetical protein